MSDKYQLDIERAVDCKLQQLDNIPYGVSGRRLELAVKNHDGSLLDADQIREKRHLVMTDIAKRVGLHFFEMTDAVLIDQLITVSAIRNHDTAGLLRSLINSFLIAYTNPERAQLAYMHLLGLEALRSEVEREGARKMH